MFLRDAALAGTAALAAVNTNRSGRGSRDTLGSAVKSSCLPRRSLCLPFLSGFSVFSPYLSSSTVAQMTF